MLSYGSMADLILPDKLKKTHRHQVYKKRYDIFSSLHNNLVESPNCKTELQQQDFVCEIYIDGSSYYSVC